jgi:hypothetical protein
MQSCELGDWRGYWRESGLRRVSRLRLRDAIKTRPKALGRTKTE